MDLAGLYRLATALRGAGGRLMQAEPAPADGPLGELGELGELEVRPPLLEVDRLLDDPRTRIIVCCGSGGVGKTTTAAALGLRAAERGRHVVVLTVDPARRLAQSMGLSSLDNTPRPVPLPDATGRPAAACTR